MNTIAQLSTGVVYAAPLSLDIIDDLLDIERISYDTPWTFEMFHDELEDEDAYFWALFFAEEPYTYDGIPPPIGYVGFRDMAGDGNITKVTLIEKYRGRGLGKFLVRFLLDEMQRAGLQKASLEVRVSNEVAIALYESCGFQLLGRRKGYYSDGEDALVYGRDIDEA